MKIATLCLLVCLPSVAVCFAEERSSIDRLDRVACIESQVPSQPNTRKLCSVFVVSAGARLFLVTAG
ncbi:serine protease, partial [Roseiconus lacunae]|nr:serine protease [Roseiconus lacunae]